MPIRSLGWLVIAGGLAYAGCQPTLARAEDCRSVDVEQCAARYDPVCASWDTGIRCVRAPCPSFESRLYTNACFACRDERVRSFDDGECPERPEPEVGRRYRVDLAQLVRRFNHKNRRTGVVDVDLEVSEPISVMRAWVWLEGEAFPGSAELRDPPGGVVEIPAQVQVAVADAFDEQVTSLARPVARLGPFEGSFKAEGRLGPLTPQHSGSPWSTLSDGRAQLQLSFTGRCPRSCLYLEDAVIEIRRAELVVDALGESDLPPRDN